MWYAGKPYFQNLDSQYHVPILTIMDKTTTTKVYKSETDAAG